MDDRPDPSEPTDDQLVAAARAGEASAFESLILRHESRVLRVLRLLGVPSADREDVAQEVFLRVFRHLGGFRPGRPFGAWIYRIAVNAAHDHRRSQTRRRREEAEWPEGLEEARGSDEESPRDRVERQDRLRRLERALGKLSDRERAVFVLCELEGLTSREVARALGITSITVRRHLGRARSHLQQVLEAEEKKQPPR